MLSAPAVRDRSLRPLSGGVAVDTCLLHPDPRAHRTSADAPPDRKSSESAGCRASRRLWHRHLQTTTPRYRDARSVPSSSAFPIGSRQP